MLILITGNILRDNHTNPDPGLFASFAADILEISLAAGEVPNCYSDNVVENTPPLETVINIPPNAPPCM